MSKENLPEKINPLRLAEAGVSLHGILHVKDMQRLCMSLASDSGEVDVGIQCGIDQQGIRFLGGHIKAQFELQCQRCMEPYLYEIIEDFLSGIVKTEEEARELPERYEPVFVDEEGMLIIQDVIEDELIIGLPIVPMHDPKECKVDLSKVVMGSDTGSGGDDNNPFKVIEILRSKNRNKE